MGASSGQNVNTLAAAGLQGAGATTAAGMGFNSANAANAYANPFQQNVIQGLQKDALTNYQQGVNQLGAEATRAGAFGGSRHGVAQGVMAANTQNALNNQIGQLRYSGYNDAMSRAAADQQMRMSAANQLGNLSNLGFGMGQTINNSMIQQGAMQQALQQMAMDKAAGQYAGYQQSPYTALTALTSALGGTPYGGTTTTNTTGTAPKQGNSLFDYMGLGLYGSGQLGYKPFG